MAADALFRIYAPPMVPVTSLLYVSRSLLHLPRDEHELEAIVNVALDRNAKLLVTGALVFTGKRFAQVLEGSAGAVDELMTSICRDRRHTDVDVVQVVELEKRRFPDWSMAYCGPSTYVDRHISPLFKTFSDRQSHISGVRPLIRLMEALVAEGGISDVPV